MDEAHFRADADLRGKWVLRGEPALVDRPAPGWARRPPTTRRSAWRVARWRRWRWTENCTAETSAAFLPSCAPTIREPLIVIWDNGPAHRGQAIRDYLATPDLKLRLVALPGYSPDFNADEAIWDWAREEVTANTCLGTKAKVEEKMGSFFSGLAERTEEVKQRCRTVLQAKADALVPAAVDMLPQTNHVGFTLALL